MELRPGLRLKSAVCSTQVVVVKASRGDVDLRCGGAAMVPADIDIDAGRAIDTAWARTGSLLGKRYVDAGVLMLLCVAAGAGDLAVGEHPLTPQSAKALPSSD